MLHGDISNTHSFNVGIRCEDTLLHLEKFGGMRETLAYKIGGKVFEKNLDSRVEALFNRIYRETPMTVSLVVDDEHFTKALISFLDKKNICYGNIVNIKSATEIYSMLNTGVMTYFISEKVEDQHLLEGSKYIFKPERFLALLQRGRLGGR